MAEPANASLRGDATLVSFPKSGRTWLRYALGLAGAKIASTHARHGSRAREMGRPFREIPADLRDRPVLFLHRNPIDTAVSFFFQVSRKDFAPGSRRYYRKVIPLWIGGRLPPREIDAFVLDPRYGVPAICAFNQGWLTHVEKRQDSLIVSYEALRADPVAGFAEIFDYLRISADPAEVAAASSFEAMQAVERSGQARAHALYMANPNDSESAKVRRGKVKGYLDYLRPETVEAVRGVALRYGFTA